MFTRDLKPPRTAAFLFGPRGTGKSTWARQTLRDAWFVNLLLAEEMLRYERDPSQFRARVLALPKDRWIVVDEIQRVPGLLDEVHYLMEEKGYRRFLMTGSSARKLKRGAANLLAGRAVLQQMFPLTSHEQRATVPVQQLLRYGALPASVNAEDDELREAYLRAYVTVYLNEEIRAEGLVRNLGSFSRFVEVAALAAGQLTNVSGLARDAGVSRETARGYFEVLVDTLVGHWLPAWRPRARVKEVALPKFYWFDPGVLRAAAGGFDNLLPADFEGIALEHLVLHEIRAYMHYANVKGTLGYWATPSGTEVDFVYSHGTRTVGIEVKHARVWRNEFRKGLKALCEDRDAQTWVVYRGEEEMRVDGTRVIPVAAFLRCLHAGQVLGSSTAPPLT
jgi:predicted AAA+ superfamily ATPase